MARHVKMAVAVACAAGMLALYLADDSSGVADEPTPQTAQVETLGLSGTFDEASVKRKPAKIRKSRASKREVTMRDHHAQAREARSAAAQRGTLPETDKITRTPVRSQSRGGGA